MSPAIDATTGTIARDQLVSSPIANSRRTSNPTVKKKIAMSASLTRACSVKSRCRSPTPMLRCVSQNAAYRSAATFAHTIAATVAASSSTAPTRLSPISPIRAAIEERRSNMRRHPPAR